MFAAFRLAKLGQSCILIEKNTHTTLHPKMEFTNHRSMEIYRHVGLVELLRPLGVPESWGFSEIFTDGLGGGNVEVPIARIDRPSPAELRKIWKESNNGSHPLEPQMRLSQIIYEKKLKELVQKEESVHAFWGYSFVSLTEDNDCVTSTVTDPEGKTLVIESQYVIGCDGAGSQVRSSIGIEAPRKQLGLNLAYAHFKTKEIEKMRTKGDWWHMTTLNGALVVSQDEIETYTVHRMIPPGMPFQMDDPVEFVKESLGGMGGPLDIDVEVILCGKWSSDLSIASSFRSPGGRVFLAGDAAHQLTPAGGHGLNSGIQDIYDLTWKLHSILQNWGGAHLLTSYTLERRPIAELYTRLAEKATMEVFLPWFTMAQTLGLENLTAKTEYGQQCREKVRDAISAGRWTHEQDGAVLGYSIVDFTEEGGVSGLFERVAGECGIPVTAVWIPDERHCRDVWERDVVLVRPDGFVAWRCPVEGVGGVGVEVVRKVLLTVVGREEKGALDLTNMIFLEV
ncbi:hypothetical protein HYFRA_00013186 [Hymenoscyphus fraxineus]|uniref:FAD-binding domain-containing protein n=1 Tax=Hymenoscyphus fraxineus TaxID=746836 RepID=A0A9N9L8L5_9HELO|nr:hypothetical protein HYFRA_00013186 [Hymenoscyphus fraxineus]